MKFLKYFEKYDKPTSEKLSISECKQLFLENCTEFDLDSEYFITRNVDMKDDGPFIVDPKSFDRKSANTKNYYTYIIDNSKNWKDYPKRKNSIICEYSNRVRNWLVIPYDNSKWGVCKTFDFWWSFDKILPISSLSEFNSSLSRISYLLGIQQLRDDTKENFFNDIDILTEKLQSTSLEDFEKLYHRVDYNSNREDDIIFLFKKLQTYDSVRVALEDMLDPKDNGVELMDYKSIMELTGLYGREVWTDSKCLLIKTNEWSYKDDIEKLKSWRKENK